ncbi:MAG: DUF3343 domain-containing protein [Eubacteriales bacterium]|nr:DUF3343 domain-containing protein [Eubacteriales bacterium]
MNSLYIKVGSVTNAQRAQRLLRSKGYRAQIKRIENPSPSDGCGYAVLVKANDDAPLEILSSGGIEIKGVEKR